MDLPDWTREPLVHFLGLGALLYAALAWTAEPVEPASRIIAVDESEQARIALGFERVMARPPTDAELDAAIDKFVRDEVLYREAIRLGLDQGDAVVRQRMVAKMDMSATAAAETAQPSEEVLRAWYEDNADRYGGEQLVSFEQAFFTSVEAAGAARSGPVRGQPISLPESLADKTLREIANLFGEQFARALSSLEPSDQWQGPIPSGFGWHLVRLTRTRAAPARFEDVRSRVESDWRSAAIEARKARAFEILKSAYRIEIDR
ncbi:peptidyl-prolyl cis-trans isomerase [Qipengyuania nanhaisediminis]|uniref:peptidylprolyl isomerase n=1 Tax=Qipengyuania nanhaisediminis TaxID=604088 RepID=UPI0038B364A5